MNRGRIAPPRSRPKIQGEFGNGVDVVLGRVPDHNDADPLCRMDAHVVEESRASPEMLNEIGASSILVLGGTLELGYVAALYVQAPTWRSVSVLLSRITFTAKGRLGYFGLGIQKTPHPRQPEKDSEPKRPHATKAAMAR